MGIVQCKGITKVYGKGESAVHALNGVDFSMEKGEFVALVGASGSGKSTLLHIVGSIDKPTSGTVLVDGVAIEKFSKTEAALFRRQKVGLIYQFYNLIPTLTVKENILMPVQLSKKKEDIEYFEELVRILGIGEKLNALPHQLSGGQQQRVAIARAMMYRPALILADEPTGNLDHKNSVEIIELLKESNKTFGQTILLITHDDKIAQETGRVITMEDGCIKADVRR